MDAGGRGDSKAMIQLLRRLHSDGYIDQILKELLKETLTVAEAAGQEDTIAMISFVHEVISRLETSTPSSSSSRHFIDTTSLNESSEENDAVQLQLISTGEYLTSLIRAYPGDLPALEERLSRDLTASPPVVEVNLLRRVLQDNIAAAEAAGFVNKQKLFQIIQNKLTSLAKNPSLSESLGHLAIDEGPLFTGHAPKFIGEQSSEAKDATEASMPEKFINAAGIINTDHSKNTKKKADKKAVKEKVSELAEELGRQLTVQGFAVCDNFLPLDVIRRVRIEAELFKEHYEQSEIWVGKQADVGAHLSVPSVRGDKVLWMCGGHKSAAPEGVSRTVRTVGEIEPCSLTVKATAPIRKFLAMKELMNACDRVVDELKLHVKKLEGIFERSDAMLAVYPSEGSRFARHIDNTTGDGRRLTLLVYLNPSWAVDQGGALRVSSSSGRLVDVLPVAGRLAMFYSSEVPHEVMPSFGHRHALTIWYYDTDERREALTRAREAGAAASAAKSSIASQTEAKHFMAELVGGDEVGLDGGEPAAEDLRRLCVRVKGLSDEALSIVSSITGAPSAKSFREGFPQLSPADLQSMRKLFRNMGLDKSEEVKR